MKIAVIGAGPAGITAAYQLSKKGFQVDVFEAGDTVGGMSKTIELWNQKVDLGPHRFFSSDPRVNKVWLELVGDDYEMVNRLTRIFYQNKFFHYPLKPWNAFSNLGFSEAVNCGLSYARQLFSTGKKKEDSFESWVVSKFGRRLFEIFFKTYSEKLWGIKCDELDSDFATQRIKNLSLLEALKNAFFKGKDNKHKTLVDTFAYPHQGSGIVYERMVETVESSGGNIFYHTPVKKVCTENDQVVGLETVNNEFHKYDQVISTMPLTRLVAQLPEVPESIVECANSLTFRNTILVYLNIDSVELFKDNWLYIHADNLLTGRITNFRNWSPQLYGEEKTSILALEYWCYDEDEIWFRSNNELINLASEEIRKTGLIGDSAILEGYIHRVKNCYPVYNKGYKQKLKPVENYLSTIDGLSVIGRYGAFKYNNQDHSILMGILAAENIADGANHNLWEINTDYEYQESAVITKTGLQKTDTNSKQFPVQISESQNYPRDNKGINQ